MERGSHQKQHAGWSLGAFRCQAWKRIINKISFVGDVKPSCLGCDLYDCEMDDFCRLLLTLFAWPQYPLRGAPELHKEASEVREIHPACSSQAHSAQVFAVTEAACPLAMTGSRRPTSLTLS